MKAAVLCMASFNLGPLEHGIAATLEKVCWNRAIVQSVAPRGVVVQTHGCGTIGIYNPTLKPHKGTVFVWMRSLPSSPAAK